MPVYEYSHCRLNSNIPADFHASSFYCKDLKRLLFPRITTIYHLYYIVIILLVLMSLYKVDIYACKFLYSKEIGHVINFPLDFFMLKRKTLSSRVYFGYEAFGVFPVVFVPILLNAHFRSFSKVPHTFCYLSFVRVSNVSPPN